MVDKQNLLQEIKLKQQKLFLLGYNLNNNIILIYKKI